ncbi:hypothetical protein WJX73_008707 [Symbiochloris irregularis]|uniref:Uncharacterized protein n=1 Tax=Symbiochloris irregularis TaxID=706552 RepID=A0AAW1PN00_9CHLO
MHLLDEGKHVQPVTPGYKDCDQAPNNEALAAFAKQALRRGHSGRDPLLPQSDTFEGFIKELKASIDRLPEAWVGDDRMVFGAGSFSLEGQLPPVPSNAFLLKGLFADTIPLLLQQQKLWATGNSRSLSAGTYDPEHQDHDAPLSYIHVDCDLFAGARDALSLLSHKIVPGTVILFDELINYNRYRDNEAKALWMWLQETGAKIATIGAFGPLPGMSGVTMDLDMEAGHDLNHQSAGFMVVSKPGSSTAMWKR